LFVVFLILGGCGGCQKIAQSRGYRAKIVRAGVAQNPPITNGIFKICTLFPGHSHYFWDRFFHEIADALHVFQKHALVAMKKMQFFMKIQEISNFELLFTKIADTPQVFQKRALVAIKNLQFL